MRAEFGRIAPLTQTAGKDASTLQREIARLSRIVATLATGMGVALFFVGQAMGLPTWENLLFAIGIIVASAALMWAPEELRKALWRRLIAGRVAAHPSHALLQ